MIIFILHKNSGWNRHRLAAGVFIQIFLISVLSFSCTNSSQIPLTVRQQQERSATVDTAKTESDVAEVAVPERDEVQWQQMEDMRREMAEELETDFKKQTNEAFNLYIKAQSAYYKGDNVLALDYIQTALDMHETSSFHALKGAIYYRLGQQEETAVHWQRAVEMDPEVISDMYPGMKYWFESHK